jgi:cytochrome c-type biogenesis protein CcmH
MSSFVIFGVLLWLLAAAFIAPPLWRQAGPGTAPEPVPQRKTALALLVVLAVGTVGLYARIGEPAALDAAPPAPPAPQAIAQDADAVAAPVAGPEPGGVAAAQGMTQARIEGMVARLAQRLQTQPDDAAGWRMLAKSYETLGRFPDAVQAYQHLLTLQRPDADLLTDYAVTLGMSQNQTLVGEPEAVIKQALAINPQHVQALALLGSAAFERRDYPAAIAQWRKILALSPPRSEMAASIEANIATAESLADRDAAQARKGALKGARP